MSILKMERKQSRPSLERLLRAQMKLDVIFKADLLNNETDVRGTKVLDVTPQMIAVAQTSPPILKSMVKREVEASFVYQDLVTSECVRWGWESQIMGIRNDYIRDDDRGGGQMPVSAVFLALPLDGALRSTNVRLDYRLAVEEEDHIAVRTNMAVRDTRLLNFSAGGAMIAMPGAPQVEFGFKMNVQLVFPWPDDDSKTTIKSRAEVVRIDYRRGEELTRLGLQFQEMDVDTHRVFAKIINHYMLAEQRKRRKDA